MDDPSSYHNDVLSRLRGEQEYSEQFHVYAFEIEEFPSYDGFILLQEDFINMPTL